VGVSAGVGCGWWVGGCFGGGVFFRVFWWDAIVDVVGVGTRPDFGDVKFVFFCQQTAGT